MYSVENCTQTTEVRKPHRAQILSPTGLTEAWNLSWINWTLKQSK